MDFFQFWFLLGTGAFIGLTSVFVWHGEGKRSCWRWFDWEVVAFLGYGGFHSNWVSFAVLAIDGKL